MIIKVAMREQLNRYLMIRCLVASTVYQLKKQIVARASTSGHRNCVPEQAEQVCLWLQGRRLRNSQKLFAAGITGGCQVVLSQV